MSIPQQLYSTPLTYSYKCFPVRHVKSKPYDGGAWCLDYTREKIKHIRLLAKQPNLCAETENDDVEFTSLYLVKKFHLEDPLHIFNLNISGRSLQPQKDEDFSLFENVSEIDASDNNLNLVEEPCPLCWLSPCKFKCDPINCIRHPTCSCNDKYRKKIESFQTFCNLERLHLQANNIRCIHIDACDFDRLRTLDLSYNTLNAKAITNVGKLQHLRELALCGCGLKQLPAKLWYAFKTKSEERKRRFNSLEKLDLSENSLAHFFTFFALSNLPRLKFLKLARNGITEIPHLYVTKNPAREETPVYPARTISPDQKNVTFADQTIKNLGDDQNTSTPSADKMNSNDLQKSDNQDNSSLPDNTNQGKSDENTQQNSDVPSNNCTNIAELGSSNDTEARTCSSSDMCLQVSSGIVCARKPDFRNEPNRKIASSDDHDRKREVISPTHCKAVFPPKKNLRKGIISPSNNSRKSVISPSGNQRKGVISPSGMMDKGTVPPNVSLKSQQSIEKYASENSNATNVTLDPNNKTTGTKQPFPELRELDISYNSFANPRALLPVAAWPVLEKVVMHGNPLTESYKDFPLFLHCMEKMYGVHLEREKKATVIKTLRQTDKKYVRLRRLINRPNITVQRNNMQLIEQVIEQAQIKQAEERKRILEDVSKDAEEVELEVTQHENKEEIKENFFITQGDEENEDFEEEIEPFTDEDLGLLSHPKEKDKKLSVMSSVQTLKALLDHPMVFTKNSSTATNLYKTRKKKRSKKSGEIKLNRVNRALENIRTQETCLKDNLGKIMKESNNPLQKDANKLLKSVQAKYDEIRVRSLGPILSIGQHATRSNIPPKELALARLQHAHIGDAYVPSRGHTPRVTFRRQLPNIKQ